MWIKELAVDVGGTVRRCANEAGQEEQTDTTSRKECDTGRKDDSKMSKATKENRERRAAL
jgi:hypothetical protein